MSQQSRLDAPEIRAVLEANRAKLAMMQHQQSRGASRDASPGPNAAAGPSTAHPNAAGTSAAARGPSAMRSNPMYGDEAASTPTVLQTGGVYAPKLAAAIRPPPISGIASDAGLPAVGDLFAAQPALPVGLNFTAADAVPHFAPWDSARPFLTGRFIYESAEERATGRTAPAAAIPLDSYPPQVQESMLVDDLLHAFGGLEGAWIRPSLTEARGGARLEFRVTARGQLDPALLEMATRMLPLCECVAVVARYAETRRRYEWGLVCQALAGAMRAVLQDWDLMTAQLEHQLRGGKLTLQALWYYVQPPMAALRLVASVAAEASARRLRGATLLSLLHAKAGALLGDAAAHRLALRLLRAAAEPYFAMLQRWVSEGVVDDPYQEFMVQLDEGVTRGDLSADGGSAFWSERLTLRPALDPLTGSPKLKEGSGASAADVPTFLERAQEMILDTGRYLNLVRSCGRQPEPALPQGIHLEFDDGGRFLAHVEQAHKSAASAALGLMRHEVGVSRGLGALKRYFLAEQGDLFLGLMDGGEAELTSFSGAVPIHQLQAVLDIAVRSSSAASDPAAARLKAAYDHRSILNLLIAITQTAGPAGPTSSPTKRPQLRPVVPSTMTAAEKSTVGRQKRARESFMLCYDVPWPLSVVVPDSALAQYQMIFRHLFELKWVDRELNRTCSLFQSTRPLAVLQRRAVLGRRRGSLAVGEPSSAIEAAAALAAAAPPAPAAVALARAYRTCQLMTHFFRQYLLYATFEVLEPLWEALETRIGDAATVDEIVDHHRVFLRKVMKGLLLSRKVVVLRSLLSLKQLALEFVALSSRHIAIDYEALAVEVEAAAAAAGGGSSKRSDAARTEARAAREARLRSVLDAALSNPDFAPALNDLRSKFEARCGDFMAALAEAHRQARTDRSDSREELESLLSLMGRLDFNGYFSKKGMAAAGV